MWLGLQLASFAATGLTAAAAGAASLPDLANTAGLTADAPATTLPVANAAQAAAADLAALPCFVAALGSAGQNGSLIS
jgi:hypothetical protein